MLSKVMPFIQVGLLVLLAVVLLTRNPTSFSIPDYTTTLKNLEVAVEKRIDSLNRSIMHLNELVATNKKNEVVIVDNRKDIVHDKIKEITRINSSVGFEQLNSDISELFPR